jgi:hypothetical protein
MEFKKIKTVPICNETSMIVAESKESLHKLFESKQETDNSKQIDRQQNLSKTV